MKGRFYVYEHCDPRKSSKVFYVGKGTRRRAYCFKREYNPYLQRVYDGIVSEGLKPEVKIIKYFDNEEKAYEFEQKIIAKYGMENLCNLEEGGRGRSSFSMRGEKNSFYGKKHTLESRKKISKNHADVNGEKNPMWGKKRPDLSERNRQNKGRVPWNKGKRKNG